MVSEVPVVRVSIVLGPEPRIRQEKNEGFVEFRRT